jgi:hypothetical protein
MRRHARWVNDNEFKEGRWVSVIGKASQPSDPLAPWTASLRKPILWGVAIGILQAFSPVGLWWLDGALVWAISLAIIAAIYIGFAVADGRPGVIAVEVAVATVFVVIAAIAVTVSPWFVVIGLVGHGVKDLWQYRTRFVATTRWWPPFCMVVDFVAATVIAVLVITGVDFHG